MVQFEENVCSETERICWQLAHQPLLRAILLELCTELQSALECNTEANQLGLCQSTLSRVPAKWDGIIRISTRYIKFPYNTVEQANVEAQFAARASFPNVIAAIDCTHIAIKAPLHDEWTFSFDECTDHMWCTNAINQHCCEVAWFNAWFIHSE